MSEHTLSTLEYMLQTLEQVENAISLIPAPDQRHAVHMIKVSNNPDWFRDLIQRRPVRTRSDRTKAALKRLVSGRRKLDKLRSFDQDLLDAAGLLLEE